MMSIYTATAESLKTMKLACKATFWGIFFNETTHMQQSTIRYINTENGSRWTSGLQHDQAGYSALVNNFQTGVRTRSEATLKGVIVII